MENGKERTRQACTIGALWTTTYCTTTIAPSSNVITTDVSTRNMWAQLEGMNYVRYMYGETYFVMMFTNGALYTTVDSRGLYFTSDALHLNDHSTSWRGRNACKELCFDTGRKHDSGQRRTLYNDKASSDEHMISTRRRGDILNT